MSQSQGVSTLFLSCCFFHVTFGMTHKNWGNDIATLNKFMVVLLLYSTWKLYNQTILCIIIEHKLIPIYQFISKLPPIFFVSVTHDNTKTCCIWKRTGLALYWNIIFRVCIQEYNVSSHRIHYFHYHCDSNWKWQFKYAFAAFVLNLKLTCIIFFQSFTLADGWVLMLETHD